MMTDVARRLDAAGWHLRSGGAKAADSAFAAGASSKRRRIYVPWRGFNGLPNDEVIVAPELSNWKDALLAAEQAHPAWDRCSEGARKLLARNVYQILGDDLSTPVECVIGWTPRGRGSGGTGQAYRLAKLTSTYPPIYDLGFPRILELFQRGWLPD